MQFSFTADTLKHLLTNIKNKFATIAEMNNKVDKVNDKVLSSNNFTDSELTNINNSFDKVEVQQTKESSLTTLSFYSMSTEGVESKTKEIELDI